MKTKDSACGTIFLTFEALMRCEKLVSQNNLLRDQLEESHQLNEALTGDLQKLTNDWEALRDEMSIKEDEWKDEEQAFNDYYSSEHNRLLNLWRDVVAVKRYFNELQASTERDLFRVKSDLDSSVRELVGTLTGYSINTHASQGIKPDNHPALMQCLSGSTTSVGLETLRVELRDMTSQRDTALTELRERDARIQRLLGELQGLPINVPTAGAQAFPMDGLGRLGHDPPRGPSVDWWVLTAADAAGTNDLTCLPKHGGARDGRGYIHGALSYSPKALMDDVAKMQQKAWYIVYLPPELERPFGEVTF
ncbi:hypothetical protein evm_012683 [Chilo suppressalis]|nr:hypothetical protein evm_012683 [Chilo suppressalis]